MNHQPTTQQQQLNNNADMKRRSKSATAGARNSVTFSDTVTFQESKPEHHQHQGQDSTAKFTLHSTNLPKPQQPIPVKVPPRSPINTKGLKQQMNLSRRQFFGLTDASPERSPHVSRNRSRNFDMKFQVRDLEKLTTEPVVSLNLPKLPSVFSANNYQPAPLSGLTRQQQTEDLRPTISTSVSSSFENQSMSTMSDLADSAEEEKLNKDSCNSEKSMKTYTIKSESTQSTTKVTWNNAGDTLAQSGSFNQMFTGNSTDSGRCPSLQRETYDDVDEQSVTITSGILTSEQLSITLHGSLGQNTNKHLRDNREIEEADAEMAKELKFAEIAATLNDESLLDDETSPTASFDSSSGGGVNEGKKLHQRRNQKLTIECLNEKVEKDLEDISPELEAISPSSPGTPTHASNSLSLSDVGRDFLIDDEIADQPALLFNDDGPSCHDGAIGNSQTDTPTLRSQISNMGSRSVHNRPKQLGTTFESPALSRKSKKSLSRTGSLDTLSPCTSIASDDMMMDFDAEVHSSIDSMER